MPNSMDNVATAPIEPVSLLDVAYHSATAVVINATVSGNTKNVNGTTGGDKKPTVMTRTPGVDVTSCNPPRARLIAIDAAIKRLKVTIEYTKRPRLILKRARRSADGIAAIRRAAA